MESDGVNLMYNTSPVSFKNVEGSDGALIEVQMTQNINGVPTPTTKQYDTVLFATGRQANLDGLNCEAAGVKYERRGVSVDKHL